jgi:hypothetical protein
MCLDAAIAIGAIRSNRAMLNKFVMSAVFAFGMAAPALADASSCNVPYAPAAVDGSTATEAQMKSAHDDTMNFIKDSDTYQDCLNADYTSQEREAKNKKDAKPLDPSIKADVNAKLAKSQSEKEKVGAEFNAAVQAYKAKHPQ